MQVSYSPLLKLFYQVFGVVQGLTETRDRSLRCPPKPKTQEETSLRPVAQTEKRLCGANTPLTFQVHRTTHRSWIIHGETTIKRPTSSAGSPLAVCPEGSIVNLPREAFS
mmetsp:Transcript_62146/g.165017  ORF Transcript_62146/g.165017 Transcript_62146/m.165017 type:complete len:110 (-) Transcript_62146:703-1032(-)